MTRTVIARMIEFTVSRRGAQLVSLIKDGTELICSGTRFWRYSAPTLFPIVGRLRDDRYTVNGKTYTLKQHGFARERDFICIDDRPLTYRTAYDDDTLAVYPFKFALTVSFQPINNELIITSRVHNLDDVDIWFSIGAHPALRVPFVGGSFSDYRLEFNRDEHADRLILKNGLLTGERRPFLNGCSLPLSYDLFNDDALIFNNLNSDTLTVRNGKKSLSVRSLDCSSWGNNFVQY